MNGNGCAERENRQNCFLVLTVTDLIDSLTGRNRRIAPVSPGFLHLWRAYFLLRGACIGLSPHVPPAERRYAGNFIPNLPAAFVCNRSKGKRKGGVLMTKATKSIPQILRENLCTVFNLLNFLIAATLAAVGVIRLAKKNVLVRDLYSLENLAHCDVVCLDKTGTLTEGSLVVEQVFLETEEAEFARLMATYLAATQDNNTTYQALKTRFTQGKPYGTMDTTPFSSERKWSSVTLEDGRTLVLGAPERLLSELPEEATLPSRRRSLCCWIPISLFCAMSFPRGAGSFTI